MIFQKELLKSLRANGAKTAIESDERNLSYAGLLQASDRVTNFLLKEGIKKETPVGIRLNDKIDMICAIIGVLNAGGTFIPLDGSLPDRRLAAICKDLDLGYVISSRHSISLASRVSHPSLKEYFFEDIPADDARIEYPAYGEDDSIYIYYTSGSTGIPKGIIGRNCSLLQFVQWEISAFGIDGENRCSQLISPYFDAFLRDIFVPLLAGGAICIPPADDNFFSPEKMIAWIGKAGITLIHCVPSVFRVINTDALTPGHFKDLKYILLSGEKLIPSTLVNWYKLFDTRIQLVNLYGATETTMIRAFYRIKPEDAKIARIPIGSPIAGTELLVLNNNLEPCDPLVPGEIYIASRYISKGYLNNAALTAEKFIKINADTTNEKIAFKTGDRARILPDGKIDLIGREDRQIKLRGIRIELDEVECTLLRSEGIKNAVVMKHLEENGDESLAAFITRADGLGANVDLPDAARKHLLDILPEYQVPANIIEVTEYPLLANGKTNYKALVDLLAPVTIIAPANETESKVLAIWKEILGDRPISTMDSFHKIGGNSLSIMKLIGRVYKEFNVRISLSDLFNNLTIRKQAEYIKRSGKDNLYIIPKSPHKAAYHVSSVQERMYYNQQLKKDTISYNLPMAWEIRGEYDKARIEHALQSIIDRHETLRTEFRFENGELLQFVREDVRLHMEEVDGRQDVNKAISTFIRPFDLGKAPLLRCGIINGSNGEKILLVDFHHIICDGISQSTLLAELAHLYHGGSLNPAGIQYKDYAEWEHNFRSTDEYISHREFWLRNFEGDIPVLDLPTTNGSIDDSSDKGGNEKFIVRKDTLQPLLDYLHTGDLTVFSGFYSLFLMFLSQLTGQEDIVIGVATSGRMQAELENVIGMFVKTLPVRYRIDLNMTFKDLVKEINSHLIQANSKQVYDLTNIVIELSANRAEPVKSLFDAVFVFQNFDEKDQRKASAGFARYPLEIRNSKYPISLYAIDDDDEFGFILEYLSAYFTKGDVDLLISQFKSLIENTAHNLDSRIGEIIGITEQPAALVEDDISFNF